MVAIQQVGHLRQSFLDLAGMQQPLTLLLQFLLLAGLQSGLFELVVLELMVVELSPGRACGFLHLVELPGQRGGFVVQCPIAIQQRLTPGNQVDQLQLELLSRQLEVLVLRMDVDEAQRQLPQQSQVNGRIVDKGARLARGQDFAPKYGNGIVIEVVFGEKGFQPKAFHLESPFHNAFPVRMAQAPRIGTGTQDQRQRTQNDRLSGTGLTRNDVQSGLKADRQLVNQGIVGNGQSGKHRFRV